MPHSILNTAHHTARTARCVLAAVGCTSAPGFYFGYWFSH
ncbi:hypothetical protein J3B00_003401 [Pseudomonas sp. BP8]|nr:hypothetical protein [Pseudomonas sp. BP8]